MGAEITTDNEAYPGRRPARALTGASQEPLHNDDSEGPSGKGVPFGLNFVSVRTIKGSSSSTAEARPFL